MDAIYNFILEVEHFIFCVTGCRIELYLHRKYYEDRALRYENYLRRHYPEWFTDNIL